jgi:hypothetical protein
VSIDLYRGRFAVRYCEPIDVEVQADDTQLSPDLRCGIQLHPIHAIPYTPFVNGKKAGGNPNSGSTTKNEA